MTADIIPPEVPEPGPLAVLSDYQLRVIYQRIELIGKHFDRCCAADRDSCRYQDEFNSLYVVLTFAGLPEHWQPCDRERFESWLRERNA